MAYFHTNVLDNQIKALPTVSTASGSVASFDTDMTENLVSCVCQLPYLARGYEEISLFVNSNNKWDEQWDNGDINATTGENASGNYVRSKNYIRVIPLKYYYFKVPQLTYIYKYDENRNYLGYQGPYRNQTFQIPNDTYYIRFVVASTYGNVYNNDISFNFSGDTSYYAFNGAVDYFGLTVYGGEIDFVTGTLTDKYNADGTEKTPVIIPLNGNQIAPIDSDTNSIYNNCGNTSVKYILSVGKAVGV